MGQTPQVFRVSDAARRRANRRLALRSFVKDESGATAIEYGLICALIFLAIVSGFTLMASKNKAMFDRVAVAISSAG